LTLTFLKMMHAIGESFRRSNATASTSSTTRQDEKRDMNSSLSDGYNSDEKKENDGNGSDSWQGRRMQQDVDMSCYRRVNSPSRPTAGGAVENLNNSSFSSLEDQDLGTNLSVGNNAGNGLHHRHNNNHSTLGQPTSSSSHNSTTSTTALSPTRRRRVRGPTGGTIENPFRRRKCTLGQAIRSILLSGIGLYFLAMVRGTLYLMQQATLTGISKDDWKPATSNRFTDIISLPFHQSIQHSSHDIEGYLRWSSGSSESATHPAMVAPVVDKVTRNDANMMKRMLQERALGRRLRTRPPLSRPQGFDIESYEILPSADQPTKLGNSQETTRHFLRKPTSNEAESKESPVLANLTQICGVQARKARQENTEAFKQRDVLIDSGARVLITGILSTPLAFHLALTLKKQCGVQVLIGMDALLPNTIRSRLQFVEQMKILATNVPEMVQPILVPFLGLDPRVKKAKKESSELLSVLPVTRELDLMGFQPTHIVHLASTTFQKPHDPETAAPNPYAPKRPMSPYQLDSEDSYEPSLFQIRTSMSGMEQLLSSVAGSASDREHLPHVTYASSTTSTQRTALTRDALVHTKIKLADEILADTYHLLYGIQSVGVRMPPSSVYGPWDHGNSDMYHALEMALHGNISSFEENTEVRELIYVNDAVQAIITAMQYRPERATNFEISATCAASLSEVASKAMALAAGTNKGRLSVGTEIFVPVTAVPQLQWKSVTSLHEGVLRTLAWHIDRAFPNGPPGGWDKDGKDAQAPVTGDDLLQKNSISTCAADDLSCHVGSLYLPCASECCTKDQCQASIFDSVRELARNMTEGCDAVLYTQSLSRDLADLQLQAQFEDDVEPAICNLAFVAQYSPLVKAVVEKIPLDELKRLGVPFNTEYDVQLEKLNGRLLYRGWILIWVDPVDPVYPTDLSLLKLSPGRMFSKDVLYAVFVEENFTVSPTPDDVRFLISQMDRGATKQKSVWRNVKDEHTSKVNKVKLIIPPEPEKRVAMLVSQLKFKISDRSRISQAAKISVLDAVRFMRFEIGSDPTKEKESQEIKLQRDFYKRIPNFVNGKDLRDGFEPLYKYELKHWVRTRWVVHDLSLEESRDLRCRWYREHVQWGSEIDQLSLANVMAQQEIERRIAITDLDDRAKMKIPEIPELKEVTDSSEWFAMQGENEILPDAEEESEKDPAKEEEVVEEGPQVPLDTTLSPEKKNEARLYVRIISDRIMSLSRKAYTRYREELEAFKRGENQANENTA